VCQPPHDHQELFFDIINFADCQPTTKVGSDHKMSSGSHVRGDRWLIQVLTPVAVLVTAVVGVRFFLRFSRRTGFWLDDWFILASLVLVWGMYAISVLGVEIGGLGTPFMVNMAIDPSMGWLEHDLKVNQDMETRLSIPKR